MVSRGVTHTHTFTRTFAETAPACLYKHSCGLPLFRERLDTTGDVHAAERFTRAQNFNCNLHIHTHELGKIGP